MPGSRPASRVPPQPTCPSSVWDRRPRVVWAAHPQRQAGTGPPEPPCAAKHGRANPVLRALTNLGLASTRRGRVPKVTQPPSRASAAELQCACTAGRWRSLPRPAVGPRLPGPLLLAPNTALPAAAARLCWTPPASGRSRTQLALSRDQRCCRSSCRVSVLLLGVRARACSWVCVRVCVFPAQALPGSWARLWTLGRRWPCQPLQSEGKTPQMGDVAVEVAGDGVSARAQG